MSKNQKYLGKKLYNMHSILVKQTNKNYVTEYFEDKDYKTHIFKITLESINRAEWLKNN